MIDATRAHALYREAVDTAAALETWPGMQVSDEVTSREVSTAMQRYIDASARLCLAIRQTDPDLNCWLATQVEHSPRRAA